jgi:hypothetical protein
MVRCCFNSYTTYEQSKKTRSWRRRHQSYHHQEYQLPRNGWGDYEGEVEKDYANPNEMNGTMKGLKHPPKKKLLWQSQAHRLNRYGKRR